MAGVVFGSSGFCIVDVEWEVFGGWGGGGIFWVVRVLEGVVGVLSRVCLGLGFFLRIEDIFSRKGFFENRKDFKFNNLVLIFKLESRSEIDFVFI